MKKFIIILGLIVSVNLIYGQVKTIIVSGTTRSYLLHVPADLPGGEKVPLVIGLHHLASTSSGFETMTGFSIKADQESFIVAYPQGIGNSWNAGGCCNPAASGNVDDVSFISNLIDTLTKNYQIDSNRVYATGFSNGAMMCYRLASEISSKLAGIAPVGGLLMMNQNLADNPVPIIHFHALDDPSVIFKGMGGYKSVPQLLEDWKTINGIASLPDTFRKENGITGILYASADSSANIILNTSKTGGHNWTINSRLGTTNKIWEFFSTHVNKVDKVYDTVTEGPRQRDYKVHIPNSYYTNVNSTIKYPLVIAAHGWYGTTDIMEQMTGFSSKADANGFFVVYLHYVGPPPGNSWNYFMEGSKPDDIGYAKAVIDTMFARYPIDSGKVFAIGFSDGCGMVNRLSLETKGLIKATGSVGGMVSFDDSVETTPVRMIHFHSKNDPSVPYSGIRNGSLNYWLDVNHCNEDPDTLVNEQSYIGERWRNSDDSTTAIFYTLPWNQHAWPVKNVDNIKLSATDLMWQFFTKGNAVADIPHITAVNEPATDNKMIYFAPNPATDKIFLTMNLQKAEKVYLEVLNLDGQIVLTKEFSYESQGKMSFPIDVHTLSKGCYLFKLRSNNNLTTSKIIKN